MSVTGQPILRYSPVTPENYVHPLFSAADLLAMLMATGGETITATLPATGATVVLTARFRDAFETVSPYETDSGIMAPSILIRRCDLPLVTPQHTITVRGVTYRMLGKPSPQNDGFARINLGLKQ